MCQRKVEIQKCFPDKGECLPDKKIVFVRAKAKYSKEIREYPELMQRFNEIFLKALQIIEPQVYYTTVPIDILPEKLIPSVFCGAKKITLFVSTLGSRIDSMIADLFDCGKTFDGFIVDAWASEALEALNESFDGKLRKKFGKGTMRFSPGYGDIDIRMNRFIVKLLNADVEVLDSGVMLPRKTTTCMIGWYEIGEESKTKEAYDKEK